MKKTGVLNRPQFQLIKGGNDIMKTTVSFIGEAVIELLATSRSTEHMAADRTPVSK